MKILTVVGARPQFIKAWPVSNALRAAGCSERIIHTGQHYDVQMSEVFFDDLGIPQPDVNLEVGSGAHGLQTGRMLEKIEQDLIQHRPDWVLVYGDTNSTLAAALAAAKLHLPIAHVESGLRSFNRRMPEEVNRVLTDHVSRLLLCPTRAAVENLRKEGIVRGVHLVGDVMLDALLTAVSLAGSMPSILTNLNLRHRSYFLATIHRAENTDSPDRLREVLFTLAACKHPVVMPLHPRTRGILERNMPDLVTKLGTNLRLIDPLGYFDMVSLANNASVILTDSGGLQKEAFWLGVPCITLREETEWIETVEAGRNIVTGIVRDRINQALVEFTGKRFPAATNERSAVHEVVRLLAAESR